MTRAQRREVVWTPLIVWAALMALVGVTLLYAYLPGAPAKTEVALAVSIAKTVLIAVIFMQLRQAAALTRLAALAGIAWASMLYLFTFAEIASR